ncbi:MAG: tyrosine recombinase XerC [Oscillospiraceae bacterium]|nr:tyrosine recombinase XerC [Oscillospiraceae bacterium]
MKKNEMLELPELVREYLTYLNGIKNNSPKTVGEYALDLRTFLRFILNYRGLSGNCDFDKIDVSKCGLDFFKSVTLNDAYAFISYCKDERGNNAATRTRKVATLRSFFKYLSVNKKLLESNPMQELESPKKTKALPKYLTLEQSKSLLENIDGKNRERDYCIIAFFLNCGFRLSELVGLNVSDIRDDGTVRVLGKGGKERTIYLNAACFDALRAYLPTRNPGALPVLLNEPALFVSARNKRISPKTVQYLVKSFLEKSGLGDAGLSTHKLRHTAATLMYQHGKVDVMALKEILGHENLGTTQIYTHIVNEQIKSAIDSNPLANFNKKKL